MTAFDDPLKVLLPPQVVESDTITVKRKIVSGHNAEVIPESAPARAVQVRTEEVEVTLNRYGCDIKMSTNLLAMPGEYTEDFNLKLDHQNRAMSERLVELGYDMVMEQCPSLPAALARANPALMGADQNTIDTFQTSARCKLFGALQKYRSAVGTLLAMCKRACPAPFDTLILPAGTPEIASFGIASTAKYSVSGISDADRTITFGSDSFRTDPLTGLNVSVSRGATSFHDGSATPQARPGCLSETHVLYVYYPDAGKRVDHKTNTLVAVNAEELWAIEVVTSSAIIGVAGAGHLALGYPTTSTFTQATSPEETTIQLRTYLGAWMNSQESVLVLPDVFIDGVTKIEQVEAARVVNREGDRFADGDSVVIDGGEVGRAYAGTLYAGEATAKDDPVSVNQGPLGCLDKLNGLATINGGISTMPMEL